MAETILLAIAEWSIRATALAAVVGLLLWIFRIKDANIGLTAWTVVLVAVLLMPVAAPVMPHISIVVPQFFGHHVSQPPLAPFAIPSGSHVPRFEMSQRQEHGVAWPDLAVSAWLAIALAMLFRLAIGLRLGARMVRLSRLADGGFRESDRVRVPVTVGIIRPTIVLPADWREWPGSKLVAVLAHERAHVARRDPLRQFFASIYRAVAWFHPLAWWLRAKLTELAEEASDDAAIAAGEDRVKYAEMLLTFIERTPHRVERGVEWEGVTMANRRTRMLRIDRVLDHTRNLSRPSRWAAAALILTTLPLIYFASVARPVLAQEPAATGITTATCGGDPAYAKWLTEDVAYIITDQERAAFVRLNSAPECSKFVEQFWLHRDPTPGTAENEFKTEHYRRIAYANSHFASARPGWQTDQGRVYITYGPPDEIEWHPDGQDQRGPQPFAQWAYHRGGSSQRGILFEFADAEGDHELRLVYMGELSNEPERGPVVFGPAGGLYVQVNKDRSIFISTPVGRSGMPVSSEIIDRNGALVLRFNDLDLTRAPMYGKEFPAPLAAGTYTLHLHVGAEDRSIIFEVK
jgi:GWxTD domain-containing protein